MFVQVFIKTVDLATFYSSQPTAGGHCTQPGGRLNTSLKGRNPAKHRQRGSGQSIYKDVFIDPHRSGNHVSLHHCREESRGSERRLKRRRRVLQERHIDGVASELIVHSGHSAQETPQAIEEVRRILLENLKEP